MEKRLSLHTAAYQSQNRLLRLIKGKDKNMKTLYVDVSAKLALKVSEDVDYDALSEELEEKISRQLDFIGSDEAEIEVLEGAKLTVMDAK
jgi:hypothetical protein